MLTTLQNSDKWDSKSLEIIMKMHSIDVTKHDVVFIEDNYYFDLSDAQRETYKKEYPQAIYKGGYSIYHKEIGQSVN